MLLNEVPLNPILQRRMWTVQGQGGGIRGQLKGTWSWFKWSLRTSGLEGASNELGVSRQWAGASETGFSLKKLKLKHIHFTQRQTEPLKAEAPCSRGGLTNFIMHTFQVPHCRPALLLLNLWSRCEVFYFLTRTNSRPVTYPFCLAKQIISTLHAYSKLGIFVNSSK